MTQTYFAEVDSNGTVLRVIVADQEFINSGKVGDPSNWVETKLDGSKSKNYAGIGYTYDKSRDAFIPPKRYASWVLDEVKAQWKPPKPMPADVDVGGKKYGWDEQLGDWKTK